MEENTDQGLNRHSQLLAEFSSKLALNTTPPLPTSTSNRSTYSLSSSSQDSSSSSFRGQPINQADASIGQSRRRSLYYQPAPPSSSSASNVSSTSLWDEEDCDLIARSQPPPFLPSDDQMRNLLSQLGSNISAIKSAYRHLQTATPPANPRGSSSRAHQMRTVAEKNMVEELQGLSDLHLQLVMMQHMQHDHYSEEKGRKEAMLKSYEGIIARFHDEIRRKDAVAEGLKETLARSMLRGEKLERRLEFLETNRPTPVSNQQV